MDMLYSHCSHGIYDTTYALIPIDGIVRKGVIIAKKDHKVDSHPNHSYYWFLFDGTVNPWAIQRHTFTAEYPSAYTQTELELTQKYERGLKFVVDNRTGRPGLVLLHLSGSQERRDKQYDLLVKQNKTIYKTVDAFYSISLGEENKVHANIICRYANHPDCCGCTLLYNFPEIATLKGKEELEEFREILDDCDGAAKMAHIAQYQISAMTFLEALGFSKIHNYTNVKSRNDITIYQLAGDERHLEVDEDDEDYDDDDY